MADISTMTRSMIEKIERRLCDDDTFSDSTLVEFKHAIAMLKSAMIYVNMIDLLLSGDCGEERFHERLSEEISKDGFPLTLYGSAYNRGLVTAAKVCESRYIGDNSREDMEAKRCAADIYKLLER